MRAGSVLAILGVALIGFAVWPAEARNSRGGAGASHLSIVTPGRFVPGRIAASRPTFQNQFFALNGFSGRVGRLDRRGFDRSRLFSPFGFGEFGGVGGFGGFGGFDGLGGFGSFLDGSGIVGMTSPSVIAIPQFASGAAQPLRPRRVEDLPPCHETTSVGVVIERGMACSRAHG